MKKSEIAFILKSFLFWRLGLLAILFLAIRFVPLQSHFLGGGMGNYLKAPWLWAWANFDGEHYLAIAQRGYGAGEEAFFPFYPLLIRFLGSSVGAGLLISHLAFFLALIGLYQLVRLDFKEKIAKLCVILLLLFPTSFYFGSVYTESLFLALVVWSFYLARRERWFLSSVLGMSTSATRFIGVLLLPVYLIKLLWRREKLVISHWSLVIIPLGLVAYMVFLWQTTGDPLKFLHALPGFGEQRSATPIFLPQVFYRYVFKILPSLNYGYFPIVFTTWLEFVVGVVFLWLAFLSLLRLKLDYSVFLVLGYLIPTLSGSFSSLPRYVLVLFPAFILLAILFEKKSWVVKAGMLVIVLVLQIISVMLFTRGYWLA